MFVVKSLIDNKLTLFQMMCLPLCGAKQLSEEMTHYLLMHICVTQLQRVN